MSDLCKLMYYIHITKNKLLGILHLTAIGNIGKKTENVGVTKSSFVVMYHGNRQPRPPLEFRQEMHHNKVC